MAAITLQLNTPIELSLANTNYQAFRYRIGRNCLYNFAGAVYYIPGNFDGAAVDNSAAADGTYTRFLWPAGGPGSFRLPGSGTGKYQIGTGHSEAVTVFHGPNGDGYYYFSLAAQTAPTVVHLMLVGENVSS